MSQSFFRSFFLASFHLDFDLIAMSDRHRRPNGPNNRKGDKRGDNKYYSNSSNKGKPSFKREEDPRNSNSDKWDNSKFTPLGPKRYQERDNYRPANSAVNSNSHNNKGRFQEDSNRGSSQKSNGFNPLKRSYPNNDTPNNDNNKKFVSPNYRGKNPNSSFKGKSTNAAYNNSKPNVNPNSTNHSSNNIHANIVPKGPKSMGKDTNKDFYSREHSYNKGPGKDSSLKGPGRDSHYKGVRGAERERATDPYSRNDDYYNNSYKKVKLPSSVPGPIQPATKLLNHQIYLIKTKRAGDLYQRIQQVGEGTYGKVYKARNDLTQEIVALKKLRLESEREGFPITSIREIKLLQSFDHSNVVGLLEMMVEANQIFMIFDYMEHDLTGLLTHPSLDLQESHRKYLFKQLMEGLNYLHYKRVIHRDIKGSNILVNNIGNLKIADFGLARTMKLLKDGESPDYTNRVITIWYRPPELLLGSTDYGREIDIWGVGCLLIELYTKMATFQGFDEVGQLNKIFNIMGTPTFDDWPQIQNLPWFEMLKPKINKTNNFEKSFKHLMSPDSFDLAVKLLMLNPEKRLTAYEALSHDYFLNDPQPEPLYFLKDLQGEWHEFETKKRRRQERKRLQDQEKLKEKDVNDNIAPAGPKSEVNTISAPNSVSIVNESKVKT